MSAMIYRRTQTSDSIELLMGATLTSWAPVRYVSSEPQPVTAAYLALEDAEWDAVAARHSDALDALLASLTERARRGEDRPLDLDELED